MASFLAAVALASMFVVDVDRSDLSVSVKASGAVASLGALHDHRFEVQRWSGTVSLAEGGDFEKAVFVMDPTSLRETATALSAADARKVERQVRKDVLEADEHPEIVFHATRLEDHVRTSGGARGTLVGNLTLHGETHEVQIPISATFEGNELRAHGSTKFKQTTFGIEPYSRYFGAVGVRNEVTIRVDLVAVSE